MNRTSLNKRGIKFHIVCMYLHTLMISSISYAQSECDKTLRVSTSGNWPPYSQRIDGQYVGLEVEIVELVLREAGFCWQYVELPSSSRAFKQFQENLVDIIPAASFTQPRRKYAEFSLPYRQEVMQLFAHTKNKREFNTSKNVSTPALLLNFGDNLIAVSRGSVYGEHFANFRRLCEDCVVETNFADERFNLVKKERVEYAVEDYLTGAYLLQKPEYEGMVKPTSIRIYENSIHYMLRPGMLTEKQLQRFNLAIIKSSKKIALLVDDYQSQYGLK
ncbi:transporter substrate-binding domain-containing protein [Pseudoalteromonas luteoviolacea]|uniref:substrate-binding periplasmic protein n=1 Tax=Pseudoalteromonas luteoviolacea TaxID=43657 RepID=UPI001B39FB25|nr:transporter substrate-binding domain-containing protein [Pseudoalteromonas luteoviolacea]MBQ4878370.1 transporter substrate-binding domain-containing protein [Pseudoalteromonas luteoviolacea]MBQ4907525.1 transporter substrate-binding domain-containing protein [Pseudoalteromonas luteoviolacea]